MLRAWLQLAGCCALMLAAGAVWQVLGNPLGAVVYWLLYIVALHAARELDEARNARRARQEYKINVDQAPW